MESEKNKKLSSLALASLICGLLFFIPLIGIIADLLAIIMGVVAVIKISNNKEILKGKGIAIAGICLGTIGLFLIAGYSSFIGHHNEMVLNEAMAIPKLKKLFRGCRIIYEKEKKYPLFTDSSMENGYRFEAIETKSDDTCLLTAHPITKGITGLRSFCITEDGIVRFNSADNKISSYNECILLDSVETRYKK